MLLFSKTYLWEIKAAARLPFSPSLQLMVAENIQQSLPLISFAMQPGSKWFEQSSSAKLFGDDLPS